MKTFTQSFNPTTGKLEWEMQDEDYDYHQEVARSAYADMLHDHDRNEKYELALKKAIADHKSRGIPAHVLDIGTGTGLLSMMAARAGADSVVACEAFIPMSKCCRDILKANGLSEKIHLVPKRSTDMHVGPDGDMPHRANILVTEVFDTELIGEGAIGTFRHAISELLEPNSTVIPASSTVYVQMAQSEIIHQWTQPSPICLPRHKDIVFPENVRQCHGAPAIHDVQLSELPQEIYSTLSPPIPTMWFDFTGEKKPLKNEETEKTTVKAERSGTCHILFVWWTLKMDCEGEIVISCAPKWNDTSKYAWRDHWMQAIYYLPQPVSFSKGDDLIITTAHDEYSFWFHMQKPHLQPLPVERSVCTCSLHIICSRARLGMMSDSRRNQIFLDALEPFVEPDTTCLCLSDGSLLSHMVAQLGAKRVFALETNPLSQSLVESISAKNGLEDIIKVLGKGDEDLSLLDLDGKSVNMLVAEPFFYTSLLPWHNLYFWYQCVGLRTAGLLSQDVRIFPCKAFLWAIAVEFQDLWKIRSPVHKVSGFQMQPFDSLINNACERSDPPVEAQHLWEYPSIALTEPIHLLTFDLTDPLPETAISAQGATSILSDGRCNGVAVWMEWQLSPKCKNRIGNGPIGGVVPGQSPVWEMNEKQGAILLKEHFKVEKEVNQLSYHVVFNPENGDIDFQFSFS